MQITIATLAEHAAEYTGGKLCLLGTFDTILTRSFPATLNAPYYLALRTLCRRPKKTPKKPAVHTFKVRLLDPADKDLLQPGREPTWQFTEAYPDSQTIQTANHIVTLNGVTFAQEGEYALLVGCDGVTLASVPLIIAAAPIPAAQPA